MTCSRWECMNTFPSDCVHGDQGRLLMRFTKPWSLPSIRTILILLRLSLLLFLFVYISATILLIGLWKAELMRVWAKRLYSPTVRQPRGARSSLHPRQCHFSPRHATHKHSPIQPEHSMGPIKMASIRKREGYRERLQICLELSWFHSFRLISVWQMSHTTFDFIMPL